MKIECTRQMIKIEMLDQTFQVIDKSGEEFGSKADWLIEADCNVLKVEVMGGYLHITFDGVGKFQIRSGND